MKIKIQMAFLDSIYNYVRGQGLDDTDIITIDTKNEIVYLTTKTGTLLSSRDFDYFL